MQHDVVSVDIVIARVLPDVDDAPVKKQMEDKTDLVASAEVKRSCTVCMFHLGIKGYGTEVEKVLAAVLRLLRMLVNSGTALV